MPQLSLFAEPAPALPPGMRYLPDVISAAEERALIAFIEGLPLKPFEFVGGFRGNRRVLSYGWRYDYTSGRLDEVSLMPEPLLALRATVAPLFGLAPERLQQALVTEYAPGAGIGWHRDRPNFEQIVGVSLLVPCKFRLRRKAGSGWERTSIIAQPRSAYLLSGEVRNVWEHSIPPLEELRYSVTFRTLKERESGT